MEGKNHSYVTVIGYREVYRDREGQPHIVREDDSHYDIATPTHTASFHV